jgi:hypothetical protein
VLTFVFLTQPNGIAILVIAAALLVVLALIEYLARPASDALVEAEGDADAAPAVADPGAPGTAAVSDEPSLPRPRASSSPPNSPGVR